MPRREDTEDILSKFGKVVVEDRLPIKDSDLAYCYRQQTLYDTKINELDAQEVLAIEFLKSSPKTKDIQTRHNSLDRYGMLTGLRDINPYDYYTFIPQYSLKAIRDLKEDVKRFFITKIEQYFNAEYNMDLNIERGFFEGDNVENKNIEKVHYEPLVRELIRQCDGVPFIDIGIERVKRFFRERIRYKKNLIIKKNRITIINYFSFYPDWRGRYAWYSKALHILEKALTFLSDDSLEGRLSNIDDEYNGEVNFSKNAYTFPHITEIDNMKVYKNGKIDLNFTDIETAQTFYEKLDLEKLED